MGSTMPFDRQLDPTAILLALGIHDIHTITPVMGGADTALWRVEHSDICSALRVFRSEQLRTYHREIAAMETAQRAGLPVPIIRAAGVWHERPALVLSWCSGVPLAHAIQRTPWRMRALGLAFGRMQARLHQVSATGLLAQSQASWIEWAGAAEPALKAALHRTAGDADDLLHLDYHPLNVLTDGRTITAVLDWANACAGDPRADVARTYTILVVEPHGPGRQSLVWSVLRRLFAWSWQQGYRQVTGPLNDMPLFYAWAGAVMARDLAPRVTNPASWWQEQDIAAIHQWARQWKWRDDQ
jgi:aminoglycoside phosphotransferase (APT) family kinase protein